MTDSYEIMNSVSERLNIIEMKKFVDDGMLSQMKITLTIWQNKNTSTSKTNGGFIPISKVLIPCHWEIVLISSKRCLPCNDYNKKQEKNHTCLLTLTSTNNGSWHRVRLLHGGIGKVPGGLLTIQKVKKEVSQVLSERRDPLLRILAKTFENGFHEFNLCCYRWIVYSWRRSTVTDGRCKDNTSMTRFGDAKVCNNLVTDEIDDHRIQSDYKCTIGLQNPKGENSTLGIASAWWNRATRRTTPMTTWPPRPRAPSTQRTWTSTREWCTRDPMCA